MNPQNNKTVYTPDSGFRPITRFIAAQWRDIYSSRHVAWRLAIRDISARYRQAALGLAWILIVPIVTTITFVLLRQTSIINIPESDVPYPVFVFWGSTLWQLFSNAIGAPIRALGSGKAMLTKVRFPNEALIVSAAIDLLLTFGINFALLLGLFAYFQIPFTVGILQALGPILMMVALGMAIGILISPLAFLYSDISLAIPYALNFLFLVTPVAYPAPTTGFLATLNEFNPVAQLLIASRGFAFQGSAVDVTSLAVVGSISAVTLFLSLIFYRTSIPILVERA